MLFSVNPMMFISVNDEMIDAGIASAEMIDRADVPDEEHHDDRGEQRAEDQVLLERRDRRVDEPRVVADDGDLDRRRQRPLDRRELGADAFDDRDGVLAHRAADVEHHRRRVARARPRSSAARSVSSAWPMSETRIGVPFLVATTMSLKSVGGVDAARACAAAAAPCPARPCRRGSRRSRRRARRAPGSSTGRTSSASRCRRRCGFRGRGRRRG